VGAPIWSCRARPVHVLVKVQHTGLALLAWVAGYTGHMGTRRCRRTNGGPCNQWSEVRYARSSRGLVPHSVSGHDIGPVIYHAGALGPSPNIASNPPNWRCLPSSISRDQGRGDDRPPPTWPAVGAIWKVSESATGQAGWWLVDLQHAGPAEARKQRHRRYRSRIAAPSLDLLCRPHQGPQLLCLPCMSRSRRND